MSCSLVILAAGMGSRYGGLKQLDAMGPGGEIIMDFSIHDAMQAGFSRVIFVVRNHFLNEFRSRMDTRWGSKLELDYVCQELDALPDHLSCPPDRKKPWGTAHALWLCRDLITGGFGIINADDYYGAAAYTQLHDWLHGCAPEDKKVSIIAYPLSATLSGHGAVSRGICDLNNDGGLERLTERKGVEKKEDGTIICAGKSGEQSLEPDALASMNLFGFTPAFMPYLDKDIRQFFANHLNDEGAECFLPLVVNEHMKKGDISVDVVPTQSSWLGVTYPDDKQLVADALNRKISEGEYPQFAQC